MKITVSSELSSSRSQQLEQTMAAELCGHASPVSTSKKRERPACTICCMKNGWGSPINDQMAEIFNPRMGHELAIKDLPVDVTLMQRVFESVVNGVSIVDATAPDMPLIYVNPAFEQMTGYCREEVLGRNCRFLQHGETPQWEIAAIREAIKRRRDVRTVLKNYTRQGTIFWNELYLSPVLDARDRLTHYVGIQNDITARVQLQQRMEYMALHDGLTDLANRTLALDRLQESLGRAKRSNHSIALLFLDLDGFKAINDLHGHDCGDKILQVVAGRLKGAVRGSDCVARLGGDEFIVMVSGLTVVSEAEEIAMRILSAIEAPVNLGGNQFFPQASLGLSISPRDGTSPDELLKAADASMYRNKQARREQRSQKSTLTIVASSGRS